MKKCTSSLVRTYDQIHGQHSSNVLDLKLSYFTAHSSFLRLYLGRTEVLAVQNVELECVMLRSMACSCRRGTGSPARSSLPLQNKFHLHEIFGFLKSHLCCIESSLHDSVFAKLQVAPDPQCPSRTSSPSPMWTSRTRESSFE